MHQPALYPDLYKTIVEIKQTKIANSTPIRTDNILTLPSNALLQNHGFHLWHLRIEKLLFLAWRRMARWLVGDSGEFGELVFGMGLVVFNCCLLFWGANRNLHGTNDRHQTFRDIASCASWLVHWKRCKLSTGRITFKDPLVHRISSSNRNVHRVTVAQLQKIYGWLCTMWCQITKSGTHLATHQYDTWK